MGLMVLRAGERNGSAPHWKHLPEIWVPAQQHPTGLLDVWGEREEAGLLDVRRQQAALEKAAAGLPQSKAFGGC